MYEKCFSCSKLGVSCPGPRFLTLKAHEALEWCKLRKSQIEWSNAKLADTSQIPKGTIDRLWANDHVDFKYDTICPIITALVDVDCIGRPCEGSHDEALSAQVERLEKENNALKEEMQTRVDYMKEQLRLEQKTSKGRQKAVIILGTCLGFTLALIIIALIIDKIDPDIGFFWLEQMFGTKGFSFADFFELL